MSEGKIRGKLLVELWAAGKPLTINVLAQKLGLPESSAMGYLLGLIKANYVCVPEKHYYAITNAGKCAIGMPEIDKESAQNILASVPTEKAFHFYYAIDQPAGVCAESLGDFVNKILDVDLTSVTFHFARRDFEMWIRSLGDVELAKKLGMLRALGLSGELLRKEIYEAAKSRCDELTNLEA